MELDRKKLWTAVFTAVTVWSGYGLFAVLWLDLQTLHTKTSSSSSKPQLLRWWPLGCSWCETSCSFKAGRNMDWFNCLSSSVLSLSQWDYFGGSHALRSSKVSSRMNRSSLSSNPRDWRLLRPVSAKPWLLFKVWLVFKSLVRSGFSTQFWVTRTATSCLIW